MQLTLAPAKPENRPTLMVFAFDHRAQLEAMPGYTAQKGAAFKALCLRAALEVQDGVPGYGVLCDARIGASSLRAAAGTGLWIGRPVELPGSYPLRLEPEIGPDGAGLANWPKDHVVKLLCFCHPGENEAIRREQEDTVRRVYQAARQSGLQFLLEIIPSKLGPVTGDTTACLIQRFYDAGIRPDWWKLEPLKTREAWGQTIETIKRNDPHIRGVVVLGLDAPETKLASAFAKAAAFDLVRGFAVGRSIFGQTAKAWMLGQTDDATAIVQMVQAYERLCAIWNRARACTEGAPG